MSPLPKLLYCSAREMAVTTRSSPAPEVQALKPGQWTIIVAYEPSAVETRYYGRPIRNKLRYAFVTAANPVEDGTGRGTTSVVANDGLATVTGEGHDVVIADMKTFLEQVMKDHDDDTTAQAGRLLANWTEETNGIVDEFGVCGKDEMASVLDVWPKYSKRRKAVLKERRRWNFFDTLRTDDEDA